MATTHTIPPTPFPRLGEIYRNLALSLGTKRDSNELDRLAREGEYDWRIPDALMERLFIEPINELTQRTGKKSKAILANPFSALTYKLLTLYQQEYLQIVTSTELSATDRKSALPLLLDAFFVPTAWLGLHKIKQELGGPDLIKILDENSNPMKEVFLWFESTTNTETKTLFPRSHDEDRYQMELIRRWTSGENLPDYKSIEKMVNSIFKRNKNRYEKNFENSCNTLAFWLLIARSVSWFTKNYKTPLNAIINKCLNNPKRTQETALLLDELNFKNARSTKNRISKHLQKLAKILYGDKTKNNKKEDISRVIEEFEGKLKIHDKNRGLHFYTTWFRARLNALNGEMSAALPIYEKALKEASYRGGENQKLIIQEALTIASYLYRYKNKNSPSQGNRTNSRSAIKRIKNQAIAIGLIPPPLAQNVVEDWELEQFLQNFHELFTKNALLKDHLPIKEPPRHYPILLRRPGESITPNLSKPNRTITIHYLDGQIRTMPQINYFVLYNDTKAVRDLLEHGALPDKLDKLGESCLLFAIERSKQSDQKEILELLLEYEHHKDTINAVTKIKKQNTLHLALELCDPSVVRRLLEMGGSPTTRADIENITVLYRWATLVTWALDPKRPLRAIESKDPITERLNNESIRRWARPYADPFGNSPFIDELKQSNPGFAEFATNWAISLITRNLSLPKLLEIGELLLKAGANPNELEFPPGIPKAFNPGRTPLMLLAEGGNAEAFDLLVRHGGDPEKRDATGYDSHALAEYFGNLEVVNYLRRK